MRSLIILAGAAAMIAPIAAQAQTTGQVPSAPAGGSVDYWASYWSSQWSSNQDTSDRSTTTTTTTTDNSQRIGNVHADSVFQAGAVVSSANLASNVSGVSVRVGSDSGANTVQNGVTIGESSFRGFAGVQAMNINTGAAASRNASVNVNSPSR